MNTDKEYIASLIGKYFEGLTSLEEEQALRTYFRGENIPDEWAGYQPLFAFFDLAAEASKQEKSEKETVIYLENTPRSRRFSLMRWLSASAAVCLLAVGLFHLFTPSSAGQFPEKSQAYIDGKKYTNLQLIQQEALQALKNIEASDEGIYSSQIEALDLIFQ